MSDTALFWTIMVSLVGGIVLIIVLANWLSARSNQRRANKMMKAKKNGTYDPKKNYMGKQGGWEPGDSTYDHQDYFRN